MKKILLIIQREYLTRVRKRMFIISTLLVPMAYLLLIFGTGYLAEASRKNMHVAIIDSSGYFSKERLDRQNAADHGSVLTLETDRAGETMKNFETRGFDGYIVIPPMDWKTGDGRLLFQSNKSFGSGAIAVVEAKLNRIWDDVKNDSLNIDAAKKDILNKSHLGLQSKNISDPNANAKLAEQIGYACGFLIYFIILIYGSQVMMGVMEEKTNRIAEIIVSSVKPIQMMLGKIIGIGLVALTQFLLWIGFVMIIYNLARIGGGAGNIATGLAASLQNLVSSINVPIVLFLFAFYFLGGFFFYASIYGAIGSAINEDVREAQSLSFPVTMLVIISIVLMTTAISNPTGPVAVWGSIIPISSPIVMMARIPFGIPGTVPWWQLGLSMLMLILGFIFNAWFAGKIYRTGILMYGKKPTWKELIKWALRKN